MSIAQRCERRLHGIARDFMGAPHVAELLNSIDLRWVRIES